jgi:hypothetical protein
MLTFVIIILIGWASISGTLLVSNKEEGGPGLSADYVHVRQECYDIIYLLINFSSVIS